MKKRGIWTKKILLISALSLVLAVFLCASASSQSPAAVNLGTAANFAILGGSAISNTGSSIIIGNIGSYPTADITGFPPGIVNGTNYADGAVTQEAQINLTTAYNDAVGRTEASTADTELGGTTKTAGVYNSSSGTFEIAGTLTLDAQDNTSAVFIFQADSTLITASSSQVVLVNGTQAKNVFWQVGSSATLGTDSIFKGNILAFTSITLNTGANVEGRLLAQGGAVILDANNVTAPSLDAPDIVPPNGTITLANPLISTLNTTQVVTITYNEPMDSSSNPFINFGGALSPINSNSDGVWSADNLSWTESFNVQVGPFGEEVNVTVDSLNARDLAGNDQDTVVQSTFIIDTRGPIGTVTLSNPFIWTGNVTQVVTVTYDELMDTTQNASINFYANPIFNSVISSNGDGAWGADNLTWIESFLVNATGVSEEVQVTVQSMAVATDVAGNMQSSSTDGTFNIDTISPTGIVTLGNPTIYEGDLIQEVTINYNEEMNSSPTPTINFVGNISPIITNGDGIWSTENIWTESFNISDNNEATFGVSVSSSGATDVAGNVEEPGSSAMFDINTIAPEITILTGPNPNSVLNDLNMPMNITGNASDDIGVTSISLYENDVLIGTVTEMSLPNWRQFWNPNDGTYNLTFEACDAAGNCASATVTNLTVDVTKCGDAITSNFTLIENLDCSSGSNGISLDADGITFDCAGHSITGDESGSDYYGVYSSSDYNNLVIKNCNITGFGAGIYLEWSSGHLITNNNLSGNYASDDSSIYLWYVTSSTVSNNLVFDNDIGIHVQDSDLNIVEHNTVENNNLDNYGTCGIGIYIDSWDEASQNNIVRNNLVQNHIEGENCYGIGIHVNSGSANNNITDNSLYNNSYGIRIGGDDNFLGNNNISLSWYDGIDGNGLGTNWSITQRNVMSDSNITITGSIDISGNGVLELINSYLTYNGAFIPNTGNLTSIADACGATVTSSRTLVNDISKNTAGNCLTLNADNIVLDCNGHSITGDNATNTLGYGVYANGKSNVTIKNCIIQDFSAGIYFDSVSSSLVANNSISNNGYESGAMSGLYMNGAAGTTVSNNHFFNNDIGVHMSGCSNIYVSSNVIENNNFVLSSGPTGYGIKNDGGSNINVTDNNITGNKNYGMYNSGTVWAYNNRLANNGVGIEDVLPDSVNWIINNRALCRNNNVALRGSSNISFSDEGVLELDNCTITLGSLEINLTGNITSLETATESVTANESKDMAFEDSDLNITLYLSENVTVQIAVSPSNPTSTPSGLSALKGIDIVVDSSTSGNLTWALIKMYYNESELTAAGIDESTLEIYYYNATSGWQLEPNQGVDTANNYVWANITHFSIYGAFGSAATAAAAASSFSGTGGGCVTNWTCTDWSSCINNVQTRTCAKTLNYCFNAEPKPAESQSCTSTAQTNQTEEKKTPLAEIGKKITEIAKAAKSNALVIILTIVAILVIAVGIVLSLKLKRVKPELEED